MRPIRAFAAVLAVAACGFAQHSGSSGHAATTVAKPKIAVRAQAPPATSGTHAGIAPTGVAPIGTGINSPFSVTNPAYIPGLAATVSGPYTNGYSGYRRYGPVVYAYPWFLGTYAEPGYADSGYADNGYPPGGYATDPDYGPQVIINQNFVPERANPVMRDYTGDSSGVQVYDAPGREPADTSSDDGSDYYLIAFKDHSIYSAFAYWIDGDTLHYVTPQRVHNQVSLALVDRELTDRLNRGRMPVKLPN